MPDPAGGWAWTGGHGTDARELAVDNLPDDIAERVHAVDFEPPAETLPGDAPWP